MRRKKSFRVHTGCMEFVINRLLDCNHPFVSIDLISLRFNSYPMYWNHSMSYVVYLLICKMAQNSDIGSFQVNG